MIRACTRLPSLFAGAILASVAMIPTLAIAAPGTSPAGPVPVPYPNPEPPPTPECPYSLCPKATATLEVRAGDAQTTRIQVLSWSWGKLRDGGTVYSADPQEGGQIVRRKAGGDPRLQDVTVYSADPQEGGQVADRKAGGGQDVSGKPWRKAQLAEPLPSGTLTVVVPHGAAVKGQHIPGVKLSARGRTYELRDVEVAACTASDGNNDTCVLTYQSKGD